MDYNWKSQLIIYNYVRPSKKLVVFLTTLSKYIQNMLIVCTNEIKNVGLVIGV